MSFTDRFSTRARAYVAGRPSYPTAAIDAIFAGLREPAALAVADLGAGTGISSRLLAAHGSAVFAIEPNAAMRDAARPDARVTYVDGTAERTTLADRSIDIVAAFQAWHWLNGTLAVAEARRIARPGGRLAIVYNERDERDPFTAAYGSIVRRYATDATENRRAAALAHAFAIDPAHTSRADFEHEHQLDRAALHARAESSSYLPQAGAAAAALHGEIDAVFDRFGASGATTMHLLATVVNVRLRA